MPIPQELSPATIEWLQKQGIDPATVTYGGKEGETNQPSNEPGVGSSILARLKAGAGGFAGGGAGALAGGEAGALVPPPFDIATIPLGAIAGGLVSSYGGQKAQQAIVPEDIQHLFAAVVSHRLILKGSAQSFSQDVLVKKILTSVEVVKS